jgi:hypothetical protein
MEIELDLNALFITAEIEYKIWPAEPEVRYDSNGTGYPGSSAEIEILDVCVTSVSGVTYDLNADDLAKHTWAQTLNRIAFEHVDESVNSAGWIADHIWDDAAAASEEWSE